MSVVKKIANYLFTRYTKVQLLVILIVIVFSFLISESNIFARIGYDAQIMQLNSQIESYRKKIATDKQELNELKSDKDYIEKFAREKYYMKRPNEDIFIID